MAERTVVEAIRDALAEELRRDWRVIVLGEDVGVHGGVFRATDGLLAEFGPQRVIDTPLAELGIVGTAIGSALNGLRPVAEIQFADYIYPAMDQIMNEAAKLRYRSNGAFGCPLVIRAPYGPGVHGGLYHSQSVEAFFCHVPGLKVVTPSTPYDAKGLLKAAIRDDDPVLFFEHKRTYRRVRGEVPEGDYVVPIGRAAVRRRGRHVSVITYGAMVHQALEAAALLAPEGIEVEVVDLRTLLPWDRETVAASVARTNKVVVAHEDHKTLGVGAEIAAFLAEELFDQLDGPIVRVAAADTPVPFAPTLEEAVVPGTRQLVDAIRRLAAY
ncbi:MAG TPA: alpha-ketoacid dehydrogenase subunit beta [Chloroflexota bacterium]|jgi:2-oxoisovalerate dehydrogenase E1 component beta subunit|nr:alpha-ketoacid dehydrogenase subunit beta [Chloroflexota bacterium]